MKIAFHTLGCKVNQYETEAMKAQYRKLGFEIVDEDSTADIYIINTCTVTNMADRKSRQYIRRAKKLAPDSVIAVTGCYSQVKPAELAQMPEVDIVTGNGHKDKLIDLVLKRAEQKRAAVSSANQCVTHSVDNCGLRSDTLRLETITCEIQVTPYEELTEYTDKGIIMSMEGRTRAYIKIQEGCDRFCAYCLIPFARGHVRSRDPYEILEEAKALIRAGFKEIVLTGINTALYGTEKGFRENYENVNANSINFDLYGIESIIQAINVLPGEFRIRLSSLEPTVVNSQYVKNLMNYRKLCPHLHLSIQSGSNAVISNMNRHYTRDEYLEIVKVLRAQDRGYGITTDIIVGFPGETEADFMDSMDIVEKAGFAKVHVFKYSRREGTKAASMQNQVSGEVKNERSDRLIELSTKIAGEFFRSEEGKIRTVLFEEEVEVDGQIVISGYTENYIRTYASVPEGHDPGEYINKLTKVSMKTVCADGMTALIV